MDYVITDKELLKELWTKIYDSQGRPNWSHILPYYAQDIFFKDSIQEIRGIHEFTAMTERLIKRSGSLKIEIKNIVQDGNVMFIEWIMTLTFHRLPSSSIYGSSRVSLNAEGKIIEQRDYYDLWGDIYDTIPVFGKIYRKFMYWIFG